MRQFNKAICLGVLATKEEVPAVECVLLPQDIAVNIDDVDANTGSDLTQVDWPAEQTMDATINCVKQINATDHKQTYSLLLNKALARKVSKTGIICS